MNWAMTSNLACKTSENTRMRLLMSYLKSRWQKCLIYTQQKTHLRKCKFLLTKIDNCLRCTKWDVTIRIKILVKYCRLMRIKLKFLNKVKGKMTSKKKTVDWSMLNRYNRIKTYILSSSNKTYHYRGNLSQNFQHLLESYKNNKTITQKQETWESTKHQANMI